MNRRFWRPRDARHEDDAAAVALHALDDQELAEAETRIAASRSATRSLDEYREVAALLARSDETKPPEELKASVLAAAFAARAPSEAPVDTPFPNVIPFRPRRVERRAVVLGGLAVGLAAAFGGLVVWRSVDDGTPVAATAVLAGEAAGDIELSWTDDDVALTLKASDLPPVSDDRVYQLWLVTDDVVRSAGVFRPGASGEVATEFPVAVGDASVFAVTIERAPDGSPAPTTDIVYAGERTPT
ncbi:MAG: anti-sigma factor [Acidimicrobiia bacterium]